MAIFGKKKEKNTPNESSDGGHGQSNTNGPPAGSIAGAKSGSNPPSGSGSAMASSIPTRAQTGKGSLPGSGNPMSPQESQQQMSQFGAMGRGPGSGMPGPNGSLQGSPIGSSPMSPQGSASRQGPPPGPSNLGYGGMSGPSGPGAPGSVGPAGTSGLPTQSGSGMPFQGGPGGPGGPPGSQNLIGGSAAPANAPGGSDRPRNQQVVYPWSQRPLVTGPPRFIDESRQPQPGAMSPSPFPRYGHAVNSVASSNGDVYLFGGLVRESVKNDLYIVNVERILQPQQQSPQQGSAAGANNAIVATLVQTTGEIPPPRVGHATVLVANVLILWGGDTKVRADDKQDEGLYLLNLSTREWTRVRPGIESSNAGPVGRYGHTVSIVGSRFYVFGGQVDGTFMNDMWSFDLNSLKTTPKWELLKPSTELPPRRTGHASVTLKDKIYIFGGTDGQYHYNDTWCYDVTANTWKELSCIGYIPVPREGHAACLVDDIMYIFGGRGVDGKDLGDLASFRISNQRWYMFANMGPSPTGRSGHALTAYQSKVVVLGGESFTGTKPDDPSIAYVLDTGKIKYPPEGASKLNNNPPAAAAPGKKPDGGVTRSMSPSERAASPSQRDQQPTSFGSAMQQSPSNMQASPSRNASMQNMATVGSPTAQGRAAPAAAGAMGAGAVGAGAAAGVAAYAGPQSQRSADNVRSGPLGGSMSPTPQYRGLNGERTRTMSPVAQDGFHYGGLPVNGTRGTMSMSSTPAVENEAMRRREAWMKAALALAVKKGFVVPEEISDVDGTRISRSSVAADGLKLEEIDTGAPGSEKERIMQALMSLKSQLAQAKSTIATQAASEADRIGESDRARLAALNEAAFHRAKLEAYESGNVKEADRLQRDRSNDMERQLQDTFRETAELERQIVRLREELKLEQQLRATAEERLNEASKRAMAAEAAQLKMHDELGSLQKRSHAQDSELRDHRERAVNMSSLLTEHQSKGEQMQRQLDEHEMLAEHHKSSLRQLQDALTATTARADEHERLHYQHRGLAQGHEAALAELRRDLDAKTAEADAHAARAAELEDLVTSHRREIDTHRGATAGGLAALLAHHEEKANRGANEDDIPTHVTDRMQALEDELDVHRQNAEESKMSADRAHNLSEEMRESNQRLERQQSALRSEMDAMHNQLSIALQEVARLKDTSSRKEVELRDSRRQYESSQVKHGMLRQFMTHRGIAMPDDREIVSQNGNIADERLQALEAENETQSRELQSTEERLHEAMNRIEVLTRELENAKTSGARAVGAGGDPAAEQRAALAERELQETHASYRERTAQLENDYQTAVQFVKGSEKMLRRMKDELTKYKTENTSLQNDLINARSGAYTPDNAAAKDIEALRLRVGELMRQNDDILSENRSLEQRMAAAIAEHKDFRDQNRDALSGANSATSQAKVHDLEAQVHSMEESLDAMRQQLQETQALNAHLSKELKSAAPMARDASASGASSSQASRNLGAAQKQNDMLRADRDHLAQRLQDAEDKLQILLGRAGTNDSEAHGGELFGGGDDDDTTHLGDDEGRESRGFSISSELDKWERDRDGVPQLPTHGMTPGASLS